MPEGNIDIKKINSKPYGLCILVKSYNEMIQRTRKIVFELETYADKNIYASFQSLPFFIGNYFGQVSVRFYLFMTHPSCMKMSNFDKYMLKL